MADSVQSTRGSQRTASLASHPISGVLSDIAEDDEIFMDATDTIDPSASEIRDNTVSTETASHHRSLPQSSVPTDTIHSEDRRDVDPLQVTRDPLADSLSSASAGAQGFQPMTHSTPHRTSTLNEVFDEQDSDSELSFEEDGRIRFQRKPKTK